MFGENRYKKAIGAACLSAALLSVPAEAAFLHNYAGSTVPFATSYESRSFTTGLLQAYSGAIVNFQPGTSYKNLLLSSAGLFYAYSNATLRFMDTMEIENIFVSGVVNGYWGGALDLKTGAKVFAEGDLSIKGISIASTSSWIKGGAIFSYNGNMDVYGKMLLQGTSVISNYAATDSTTNINFAGGAGIWSSNSRLIFRDDAAFINNSLTESGRFGAYGGAIFAFNQGAPAGFLVFEKDVLFQGNRITYTNTGSASGPPMAGGGAIYLSQYMNGTDMFRGNAYFYDNTVISYLSHTAYGSMGGAVLTATNQLSFHGDVYFFGNKVFSPMFACGGALALQTNGSRVFFEGSAVFTDNSAQGGNSAYVRGGAIYLPTGGRAIFSTHEAGQYILFENNYISSLNTGKQLNSIFGLGAGAAAEFHLAEGTSAYIRDPFMGAMQALKSGDGDFYLWGDNMGLSKLTIDGGKFYFLFDDDPDTVNDPQNQRLSARLSNAVMTNVIYRPKITSADLAWVGNLSADSQTTFMPYGLSLLDVDVHTYTGNDTSAFSSWESDLAKFTPGADTEIEIKGVLDGYKGLTALADLYRIQDNLTYAQRDDLDYLYMTGDITNELQTILNSLGGDDDLNYQQIQQSSIREFNRRVTSRLNNRDKDDPIQPYQHFWLNASKNWIRKDSTRSSYGYSYDPIGFVAGYDYDIIPDKFAVGSAFGYGYGQIKADTPSNLLATNDVDEYIGSLYAKYSPNRFYTSVTLGGGIIKNDTTYVSPITDATGQYNSRVLFANTEIGYDISPWKDIQIKPYTGIEYSNLYNESHQEKGTNPRYFGSSRYEIIDVPFGVRTSADIVVKDRFMITPALDAGYVHNFGDQSATTSAYLVSSPSSPWHVSSSSEKRDGFRGGVNLKVNDLDGVLSLNLGYNIELRSDYTNHQALATFRFDFPKPRRSKATGTVLSAAEAPTVSSPWKVQVSANFTSKLAYEHWDKLTQDMPALKAYEPEIVPTSNEFEKSLYMLRFGPFETFKEADATCRVLKKEFNVDCYVPER